MQSFRRLSESYQRGALWFLLGGIGVIVLLMPYHAFLSTWLGTAIGPYLVWKAWKEMLIVVMVVAALGLAAVRPAAAKRLLKQPLTIFILLYAGLFILLALLYDNPLKPTAAGLLFNLRFLALFLLAQVALLLWPRRTARLRHWLTVALLASTAVVSVLGILQVTVIPKEFLTHFGYEEGVTIAPYITIDAQGGVLRAFATLSGPNPFGLFLLLPLSILAVYIVRRKHVLYTAPVFVLGLIALFFSSSRSAWLGAIVAALVLGALMLGRERLWRYTKRYGIFVLIAVVGLSIASVTWAPLRLAVFHSSPSDPSLFEGSTAKHFQAIARGFQDAVNHPFGRGPGQAGPASFYADTARIAENYYIQIAQEGGVLALLLFLTILFLVGRKLWRAANQPNAPPSTPAVSSELILGLLASFAGIAVVNLFTHGWADAPAALTWWGLAGLALWPDNKSHEPAE